jgi:hypothetical protein
VWQYGCFESFPFLQNFVIFVRQITSFRWTNWHWTSGVNVHNKSPIDLCRFNVRSSTWKNLNIFCKRQISIKLIYLYQRLQCRDNYFFKIKFVLFLYLRLFSIKGKRSAFMYIFLISHIQWGTEHQYLLSRFLGVSILQLLIIYRIYGYDMLTLSQQ